MATELVNMKQTAAEAKEYTTPSVGEKAPEYPYGLCLSLNEHSLAKLGIKSLPDVGTALFLEAKVVVKSVGVDQQQGGEQHKRCELQITDMALLESLKELNPKAFYSKSKMEY